MEVASTIHYLVNMSKMMICNSAGSRISRRKGACTHWGGMDLQCGCFLVKMYAKTKLGPIGGVCPARPPRSAKAKQVNYTAERASPFRAKGETWTVSGHYLTGRSEKVILAINKRQLCLHARNYNSIASNLP